MALHSKHLFSPIGRSRPLRLQPRPRLAESVEMHLALRFVLSPWSRQAAEGQSVAHNVHVHSDGSAIGGTRRGGGEGTRYFTEREELKVEGTRE